jgi:hypothetical protein
MRRILPFVAALITLSPSAGLAGDDGDHDRDDRRRFKHIFLIMMENHGTDQILGNHVDAPFINELAGHSGVAWRYYGVTHPSLPNYLALFSGSIQGIWDDCKAGPTITCGPEEFVPGAGDATDGSYLNAAQIASASAQPHWFSGKNLVDQIESSRRTWKAYMQSMPATGGIDVEYAPIIGGTTVKLYAQKHNPFAYFTDIRNNPQRVKNVVPLEGNLDSDLASGKVADFVWISPDQCNDMHGISASTASLVNNPACGFPNAGLDHGAISLGDAFLKDTVHKIVHSDAWNDGSALIIVWDEDDYTGFAGAPGSPIGDKGWVLGGSRAPAIIFTSDSFRHRASFKRTNHYSLLGTIERLWGLGCLGETCNLDEGNLLLELFDR